MGLIILSYLKLTIYLLLQKFKTHNITVQPSPYTVPFGLVGQKAAVVCHQSYLVQWSTQKLHNIDLFIQMSIASKQNDVQFSCGLG